MGRSLQLILFALALRTVGATARARDNAPPIRAAGWLLCSVAIWIGVNAVGAWAPLWPVLALGVVSAVVAIRLARFDVPLRVGSDCAAVLLLGLASTPTRDVSLLVRNLLAVSSAGYFIDWMVDRASVRVRTVALLLLAVSSVVVGVFKQSIVLDAIGPLKEIPQYRDLLHVGFTPAVPEGDRIVLETGAVAWLERPGGTAPYPGALFFHGAHPDGSSQPAGVALRRALLSAGFVVLSIDHAGFGDSPFPRESDVEAWNPLPTVLAAYDRLLIMPDVDQVFVVGHSMGASDALRLLAARPRVRSAVLFGASAADSTDERDYWYGRFHSDRRMSTFLPPDRVFDIRDRFYNNVHLLTALPPDHAPILFARFEYEHPDIVATRDALYDGIPGRKAKWDLLASTHYFSSYRAAGLVLGDTRVTRAVASQLRLWRSGSDWAGRAGR